MDTVSKKLKPEDIIIMMSDGVFDGPKHIKNNDVWLKHKIQNLKTSEPQEIADLLLEEVIREESGEIYDDMTIVVAKIKKHKPKWTSIPVFHRSEERRVGKESRCKLRTNE